MVDRNTALSVVRSPRIENMDMNSRSHELHLMNIMKITTINLYRNIFYIRNFSGCCLTFNFLEANNFAFQCSKKKREHINVHIVNH